MYVKPWKAHGRPTGDPWEARGRPIEDLYAGVGDPMGALHSPKRAKQVSREFHGPEPNSHGTTEHP